MTHSIVLLPLVGDFAHNKDVATQLRQNELLPRLAKGETIILDFANITGSTQSFIHALIAEPLQLYGKSALQLLQFKSASPILKTLISLVIDYTLLEGAKKEDAETAKKKLVEAGATVELK